ncbi:pteridine-dependent deoxygenase like protein [Actinoplanes sp. NBRC 14428]|uniref:FkbO/Hyg5 family chorismatase n=1 Tax=Pseudosporangium ferrugineum TaxID=439699 RepID=A0A2T0SEH3_9ACTN|nr:hypothetical protein [Pseudosporangium ferrugineum]PRY31825.1 FkbO/Hyg5 family chorismatase [Pseudosporangium ferrugineum]BCJ49944.1 pteridine-dependent deoxygenase like protein [Actinoplanes sp. NBRC 14428]
MDTLSCRFGDPAGVAHPLGVIRWTTAAAGPAIRHGAPALDLHVARDPGEAVTEVWTTNRPVTSGVRDDIAYGHDGRYAFCAVSVPPAARYAPGVQDAYLRAFALLGDLGYPYVFRMWNAVGRINEPNADGLETYRDFCRGRADAFARSPLPPGPLPAGTGVGARTDGVAFYLLARREPGHTAVENRRQVPAYRYPVRYGPRPPAFARASRLPGGPLLVSGTASILGHETAHAGDLAAQCRTTLENLAALADPRSLRAVKVYVRHPAHRDPVRRLLGGTLTGDVAYLTTDLCRRDLLVEVEGMAPVPVLAGAG